jgi:hypothetical protein
MVMIAQCTGFIMKNKASLTKTYAKFHVFKRREGELL